MSAPTTSIDPRFSEPSAAATSWEAARDVLERTELAWLTTVRADGRPHVTPLVAVWLEDALHFCTGEGEQKELNLRHHRQVALTVGCNTWDRGLDVVVEGEAERVTDPERLGRLAEAWATKWDGRWWFEVREGGFHDEVGGLALVFAVAPRKVLAFAKGDAFSQTTHRF